MPINHYLLLPHPLFLVEGGLAQCWIPALMIRDVALFSKMESVVLVSLVFRAKNLSNTVATHSHSIIYALQYMIDPG